MHRNALLNGLRRYADTWAKGVFPYSTFDRIEETAVVERFIAFVQSHETCFERTLALGHVTGSAFVVDPALTQTLLTHHRKLDKWLQLGGHADGDSDIASVALREAREESGLSDFTLYPQTGEIFDLDIHLIPARKNEGEHIHFDVRYCFLARPTQTPKISEESNDVAWHPIDKARLLNPERSMERPFEKLIWMRLNLTN